MVIRGTAGANQVVRLRRAMRAANVTSATDCTLSGPASLGEVVEALTWFQGGSDHSFGISTVGGAPGCSAAMTTALSRLGALLASVYNDRTTVRVSFDVPAAP